MTFKSAMSRGLEALFVGITVSACGVVGMATAADIVNFQLKWQHSAQFTGFYAAEKLGFYTEEGIEATLLQGGPGIDVNAPVLEGKAQFGIDGADHLIELHASGTDVSALGVIFHRSPIVYIADQSTGITRPDQFAGRTIRMVPSHKTFFRAFATRNKIPEESVKFVSLRPNAESWESGKADVWSVYSIGMLAVVEKAGHSANVIFPDDYGLHFAADTIFARRDFVDQNPGLAKRFIRASRRGWEYALAEPAKAVKMVPDTAPGFDATAELNVLLALLPMLQRNGWLVGTLNPPVWEEMTEVLRRVGVIQAEYSAKSLIRTDLFPNTHP